VEWVGAGPVSRSFKRQLEMAGESEAPVLLEGETGVGKELAARLVHQYSSRREFPWVAVHATSLGEALFESELFGHRRDSFSDAHDPQPGLARSADGGTLFLDEVAELSRVGQSKLLRFLDHRAVRPVGGYETAIVDVRFVCATNRDLLREVEEGRFRRDLYYRLRVLSILVPPLRNRREDIPPLVRHYCKRFGERFQKEVAVDAEAMDLLMAYDWPGNVRELVNEVKRVAVLMPEGGPAGADLLSPRITSGQRTSGRRTRSLKQRSGELEKRHILETLEWTGWNVSAAARELDMSRVGLAKKMRRLDIRRPERRSSTG
jgi:DNA-binding NtrC family response regulator